MINSTCTQASMRTYILKAAQASIHISFGSVHLSPRLFFVFRIKYLCVSDASCCVSVCVSDVLCCVVLCRVVLFCVCVFS